MLSLDADGARLRTFAAAPRLQRWTMAVKLLPLPAAAPRSAAGLTRRGAAVAPDADPAVAMALGLSDNSVLLYSLRSSGGGADEEELQARFCPRRLIMPDCQNVTANQQHPGHRLIWHQTESINGMVPQPALPMTSRAAVHRVSMPLLPS